MFYTYTISLLRVFILFIFFMKLALGSLYGKENTLLLMVTDKSCLICMVWEKQIGKIYPKTGISNKFPLSRIEIRDFVDYSEYKVKKTNITPTFIFIRNNNEQGRIEGYTSPEMFWWQVDEIVSD